MFLSYFAVSEPPGTPFCEPQKGFEGLDSVPCPRVGAPNSLKGGSPRTAAVPGAEGGSSTPHLTIEDPHDLHLLKHLGKNETRIMPLQGGKNIFFQFRASRPVCHQRPLKFL